MCCLFHPDPRKEEGMDGPQTDFATDHAVDNIMMEGDTAQTNAQPSLVPQPFETDMGDSKFNCIVYQVGPKKRINFDSL